MPCAEVDAFSLPRSAAFCREIRRIAMLELGGENSTSAGNAMDYVEFGALVGDLTRERQRQFFKHPISLPLSRPVLPGGSDQGAVDDSNASMRRFARLMKRESRQCPTADQALVALNVLHQYELSEYGVENFLPATISEAHRILDIDQIEGAAIDEAALRDLIRAAMNFDYVDKAIELGEDGAGMVRPSSGLLCQDDEDEGDERSARQGPARAVARNEAETEAETEAGTEAVVLGHWFGRLGQTYVDEVLELLLAVASRPKETFRR